MGKEEKSDTEEETKREREEGGEERDKTKRGGGGECGGRGRGMQERKESALLINHSAVCLL